MENAGSPQEVGTNAPGSCCYEVSRVRGKVPPAEVCHHSGRIASFTVTFKRFSHRTHAVAARPERGDPGRRRATASCSTSPVGSSLTRARIKYLHDGQSRCNGHRAYPVGGSLGAFNPKNVNFKR